MSENLIGKRLGDYTLVSLLATGGMARIYVGEDARLGRQAAVKVLDLAAVNNEDDTLPERFVREARAVAKFEHPNIISIYQFGEFEGVLFIVMPLVRGRDLQAELVHLRKQGMKMDIPRGLRLLEQIATALDYAHAAGIVHRDVKPSNILIDANDRAVLTDFGLVFQPKEDHTLGTAFGTPRYISPEQAVASEQAVPQSDIYSLAVILYEILTGQTPFNGTSPMQIALAQINDEPPRLRSLDPSIPEAVEREVHKALSKTPENRHAKATDFITAVKTAYAPFSGIETKLSAPTLPYSTLSPEDSWDDVPSYSASTNGVEYDDDAEEDDELDAAPRRGKVVRLIFLLLAVVLIGAEIISVLTNTQSTPPPDPTLIVADGVAGDLLPAALIYTPTEFSLVNTSPFPLNIQTLVFQNGTVRFELDSLRRPTLPPGQCVRILLGIRTSDLPDGCRELYAQAVTADTTNFFWLNGENFDVTREGTLTATCPVADPARPTICTLALPAVTPPGV